MAVIVVVPVVRTFNVPSVASTVATAVLLEVQLTVGTGPTVPFERVLDAENVVGSASPTSRFAGSGTVALAGAMASAVISAAATTNAEIVDVGVGAGSVQAAGKAAESVVAALAARARNSPEINGTDALVVNVTAPAATAAEPLKLANAVIFGAVPSE